MMKTTSILTISLLSALPAVGCMSFGQKDPAPPPTAFNRVTPVSYEEEVQRGQSPDETPPTVDRAWWDPTGVGQRALEVTGHNSQDKSLAKQLFAKGEALYEEGLATEGADREKKMLEAVGYFKRAALYQPGTALEEDSLMYAGECYFFIDYYADATTQYDNLIKKHPNTKHLDVIDVRRFKLARYWLDRYTKDRPWAIQPNFTDEQMPTFDSFGNAIKLFDLIRLDDPTGDLADDATLAAANAHFREANFETADRFYTDLRQNFPTSEHQFNAHYLGVVTKMKVYQGPDYDGKPLDDAEKLLTRMKRQFPDKTQENIEVVEKLDYDIRAAKAQRLWFMAAFYDQRSDFAGARHYYRKIIQEYPSSNMATTAKDRLAEIEGRPDSPTPPGQFLYSWLDRRNDRPQAAATPIQNIATAPDEETDRR
ncbi:outer membrane protein assembly factor BamD [Blastopirellula marina]|uniref:Outer membrane lipoprotein BamD-like domain-containing protein n=1 Tax=Blastopirellula marina TaxID=124 RepID=A0A2S8G282_9BACT|nr:outer membrane protein assembly factor BamD [Blastopirellula marina]PQO38548.1 hypothetical protein C5Y98_10900 [Blastopirellula marina]PTL45205.1 outer membrane protein assembly factor BamD [Blastopirellula marina]